MSALPEDAVSAPVEPPPTEMPPAPKRKGHGRRCKPKDLPRRREEIDLSEAEKLCACCGTAKIRIGQNISERLDYQPMAIFSLTPGPFTMPDSIEGVALHARGLTTRFPGGRQRRS